MLGKYLIAAVLLVTVCLGALVFYGLRDKQIEQTVTPTWKVVESWTGTVKLEEKVAGEFSEAEMENIVIEFLNTTDVSKSLWNVEIIDNYDNELGGKILVVRYSTLDGGHPDFLLEPAEFHIAEITLNAGGEVVSAFCVQGTYHEQGKIWDLINQRWVIVETYSSSAAWNLTDNENILSKIIERDNLYFTVTEKWCEISWDISPTEPVSKVMLWVVADAPIEFPRIYWYTWNGSEWIRGDMIDVQGIETETTYYLTRYLPDSDNEFKIRIYQASDMWNSTGRLNRVSLSVT